MKKVWGLKVKKRKDGSVNYLIAVPKSVEFRTGLSSKSCDTLHEARTYSLKVQHTNASHSRNDSKKRSLIKGTVRDLVEFYKSTKEYRNLAESSILRYDIDIATSLDVILPHASVPLADLEHSSITKEHVTQFMEIIEEDISDNTSGNCVKVMRRVFSVNESKDRIKYNPWTKPSISKSPDRKILWEEEHIERFVETADDMGLHNMGTLAIMCYHMCQRPGDMRQLEWHNLKRGVFDFTQEKTGAEMQIPITDRIEERISKLDHREGIILFHEDTGLPYDRWAYKIANRIKKKAGLPSYLQLRDLRRTGATMYGNHYASDTELISLTGHRNRQSVKTYVRESEITARNAMGRVFK